MAEKNKANSYKNSAQTKTSENTIFNDPNNTFVVLNAEVFPSMTEQYKKRMSELLRIPTFGFFRLLVPLWMRRNNIEQMLVKVSYKKDEKSSNEYALYMHPKFRKFDVGGSLYDGNMSIMLQRYNVTKSELRSVTVFTKWFSHLKQLNLSLWFSFCYPWQMEFSKYIGKPINSKYVVDSQSFALHYRLQEKVRFGHKYKEYVFKQISMRMKGYTPRLKKGEKCENNAFTEKQLWKKTDLVEFAFQKSVLTELGQKKSYLICSLGTDFYSMYYAKAVGKYNKLFVLSYYTSLKSQSYIQIIDGINVLPHEMFVNPKSSVIERLRLLINQRFDLCSDTFFGLLIPSNYLNLSLSKTYHNKIKMGAEFGINFTLLDSLSFDFGLLRISGEKGSPNFGLKFDF